MKRNRSARTAIAACSAAVLLVPLAGCLGPKRGPDMHQRLTSAPPIRIDDTDEVHLLVMQAPNPGWSFSVDRDETTPTGKRLYITIRKPDPSMLYPQVIVEKNLRTRVRADVPIELRARMLEFKETTRGRGYAELVPVDHFGD